MKILFLSKSNHVDYLCDCLFIGLRELYGADVVDVNPMTHIYTSYPEADASKLYGKGFTVTRVLEDLATDRTDITNKIKQRYFDLIVYGSIWRFSNYLDEILKYYPKNRVILVDGEDETNIHALKSLDVPYFKRELTMDQKDIYPITFAFPTNKLFDSSKHKVKDLAHITPLDRNTYVYSTQEAYYQDYREARFAITLKKAGWDCLRHYEIMGNGCVPVFLNLHMCPRQTLVSYPKALLQDVYDRLGLGKIQYAYEIVPTIQQADKRWYSEIQQQMYNHCVEHLSTQAAAQQFINTINSFA